MAVKFAILTFTKNLTNLTIHIQIDNKVALLYLLKMGSTDSLELLKITQLQSVWRFLLSRGIIITSEYLPSKLNVQVEWEFWNARDSSDWKFHQSMFQSIIKHFGYPTLDLFAFRLCHQLPQHVAWKPNSNSLAADTIQRCWNKMFPFAFPLFSLISQILRKILSGNCKTNDNSYTHMTNTTLVSSSVRDVNAMPTTVDTTARSTVRF